MTDGWIKAYRQLMDSQVWESAELLKVWMWCLFKASYKEQWFPMTTGKGETQVKVEPGQFVYGRNSAAKELRMKPEALRSRLGKLEKIGNIAVQSTSHYSLATVVNWASYQSCESEYNQPNTNETPTNPQANTTYKKGKKGKKGETPPASREPNPLWDALATRFFPSGLAPSDKSRLGRVVRDLKAKNATAEEVERRCAVYRRKWPNVDLTLEALLKHWDVCGESGNGAKQGKYLIHG